MMQPVRSSVLFLYLTLLSSTKPQLLMRGELPVSLYGLLKGFLISSKTISKSRE
jgi:hypothetical protein